VRLALLANGIDFVRDSGKIDADAGGREDGRERKGASAGGARQA
jgi:hypothetical protein